jgi:hypothetical protein
VTLANPSVHPAAGRANSVKVPRRAHNLRARRGRRRPLGIAVPAYPPLTLLAQGVIMPSDDPNLR